MGAILQIPQEVEFCLGHTTTLRKSWKSINKIIDTLSSSHYLQSPHPFVQFVQGTPATEPSRNRFCKAKASWIGRTSCRATITAWELKFVHHARSYGVYWNGGVIDLKKDPWPFQSSSHLSQASMVFCGNSCKYLIAGHLSFSVSFSCAIKRTYQ